MDFSYPQYRKNTSGTSFYQITSATHVVELQRLGSKFIKHDIEARILPEKTLIHDLLHCADGHYLIMDEDDWKNTIENKF